MSTDTGTEETPTTDQTDNIDASATDAESEISTPEFQELPNNESKSGSADLSRIQNIQIEVTAELGRTTIPIQELMEVTEGSVLELNREINSPVDLCAQGTPLATGEVIVVDGNFAIRITQVFDTDQGQK